MWGQMARIIYEVQPKFVFVENSPMLTSRGLGRVLGDLASMGFDARWGVLGAADVGAPHQRDRIWIVGKVAHPKKLLGNGGFNNSTICLDGKQKSKFRNDSWQKTVAYTSQVRSRNEATYSQMERDIGLSFCGVDRDWWTREPESTPRTIERNLGRVADGVADRVDRLKAIGNGQVPLCAATAWRILSESL